MHKRNNKTIKYTHLKEKLKTVKVHYCQHILDTIENKLQTIEIMKTIQCFFHINQLHITMSMPIGKM